MSELRTAAKAALWAFQYHIEQTWPTDRSTAAIADLRAALAQQEEPVTEDMKSAVRLAPSSAYWSRQLRGLFGPDAREGIDALERRLAEAQQAEPVWMHPWPPVRAQQAEPQTIDEAMQQPRAMAQAYEAGYKAGRANEREACEKACEHQPHWVACVAAIRARGGQT